MSDETNPLLKRRAFLAYCSGAGIGAGVFPSALWAQTDAGRNELTSEMIANAASLAGLDFSAEDRAEMLAGIEANVARFEELRALRIDQSVPPPLYFNPAVPGQVFDEAERPLVPGVRRNVNRPADLEDVAFWPVTDLATLVETQQVTSTGADRTLSRPHSSLRPGTFVRSSRSRRNAPGNPHARRTRKSPPAAIGDRCTAYPGAPRTCWRRKATVRPGASRLTKTR